MPAEPHRAGFARRGAAWTCALLALGGLGVLGSLVRSADTEAVGAACRTAGWGAVLIVAAPAVGLLLHTLAWRLLWPANLRPRLRDAYRTFVAAQAGNELGFGFLGESLKVAAFPAEQRAIAVSAVALDNLTSAFALAGFFFVLGGAVGVPALSRTSTHSFSLVVAIAVLGVGSVLVSSPRVRTWALGVLRTSRDLFRKRPLHVALATGLHLLGKLWLVAEMGLAIRVLGVASIHGAMVLGLASALAAAVGSPVPGQIGVVEAALVGAADAAGIGPSMALAIGLLRRLRSSMWLAVGALAAMTVLNARERESFLMNSRP